MVGTSYREFAKNVGLIGSAQALASLGSFLLLPIITKDLGAYNYGIWSQISITISLISPLVLISLPTTLIRFLSAEKNKAKIRESFFSVIFFVAFTGLFASLLVYLSSNFIAAYIFKDINSSYYIKASSFIIFLTSIVQITTIYYRIFQQIKLFSYLTIFQTFGTLILTLVFLLMGFGLMGVISATLIIQSLVFIISTSGIISQIGFAFPKFNQIGDYLKYSIPLTPNKLIRWITDSSDRYIIGYFIGLNSVGIYSASYAIGGLINLIVTPLQFILFPELSRLFDEGKINEVKTYLGYSTRYFLLLAIPAVFGLSALSKSLLNLFTTSEFESGYLVIPFIATSALFAGIFQIIINVPQLIKMTKYNVYINIFAAFINITFNLILIPFIGILGAAFATMMSYIAMALLCIYVSFEYISFNLDYRFIAKCIIASSIMSVIVLSLSLSTFIEILLGVGVGFISYFLIMISINSFSKKELTIIKAYMKKFSQFPKLLVL